MRRLALFALTLSLPVAASAQKDPAKPAAAPAAAAPSEALPDTLRPGDLDLSALPTGETTYTVRLLAPMQQEIGTITDRTARDGDVITRTSTVSIPMAGQNETTRAEVDADTYAFRMVTMEGSTAAGTLALEDGVVTGERAVAEQPGALPDPVAVNEVLDGPVFGGGLGFVLPRVLPLVEGHVHHVVAYSARDGVTVERVSVLPAETLKPGGGAAVSLVPVEVVDGEQTMTYYVDPETRVVELVRFSPQAGVEVEFDRD